MSDERSQPREGHGDDDFDRIVAGLELSMPDDLRDLDAGDFGANGPGHGDAGDRDTGDSLQHGGPADVFDPRISDPLDADDRNDENDEDDLESFIPPEPGPSAPLDPVSRAAWAVLIGAPAALLIAVVLAWHPPRSVTGVLVLGFVGALVLLLFKRGNSSRGDDPDQGAVL